MGLRASSSVLLAAAALAACGDTPVPPGVSKLVVKAEPSTGADAKPGEHYLNVGFVYRPSRAVPEDEGWSSPIVRTACQVGALRFVTVDETTAHDGRRNPYPRLTAVPFAVSDLPARPSLCDLQIYERLDKVPRRVRRVCVRDGQAPVDEACPPNAVDGPGQAGFSIPSFAMEQRADGGSYEYFHVRYAVQSHAAPRLRTRVDLKIGCSDGVEVEQDHPEAGALDVGEAFYSSHHKFAGDDPPADRMCNVSFLAVDRDTLGREPIAAYCYRGHALTPGACPG